MAPLEVFKEGMRVMGIASHGAFAELLIEEKQALVPRLWVEHAAGFLMTRRPLILPRPACGLKPRRPCSSTVVGGVGTTAMQIGKALGARFCHRRNRRKTRDLQTMRGGRSCEL